MTRVNNAVVYDFETMGQDGVRNAVVNMALLNFDTNAFISEPYTYDELLDDVRYIKFDVADQVKNYNRTVDKNTVAWWREQSIEAQKMLRPAADDKSISELHDFWYNNVMSNNLQKVFTRNNTFDPIFFEYICESVGKTLPYEFWKIRDTKSLLDGLSWGTDLDDRFIPPGLEERFIQHDPRHDVVMDVMRIQYVVQQISEDDGIPF
jgi:hypothetical protein